MDERLTEIAKLQSPDIFLLNVAQICRTRAETGTPLFGFWQAENDSDRWRDAANCLEEIALELDC